MKKIVKNFVEWTITFAFTFILAGFYFLACFNAIRKFISIDFEKSIWIVVGINVLASFAITYYFYRTTKEGKFTNGNNWIYRNIPNLMMYYTISIVCFVSIRTEIEWSKNELKDILSLEWTIFAISIAIFLVWNSFILKQLQESKPNDKVLKNRFEKLRFFLDKNEYYEKVSDAYSALILLCLNMFILVAATASVYIAWNNSSLLHENLVIISFYLCTNTLIQLFLNIIMPLMKAKKLLLEGMTIDSKEINEVNVMNKELELLLSELSEIDHNNELSDVEKFNLSANVLRKYSLIENEQKTKEVHNHDQLRFSEERTTI